LSLPISPLDNLPLAFRRPFVLKLPPSAEQRRAALRVLADAIGDGSDDCGAHRLIIIVGVAADEPGWNIRDDHRFWGWKMSLKSDSDDRSTC
jgi:hypothetical protein